MQRRAIWTTCRTCTAASTRHGLTSVNCQAGHRSTAFHSADSSVYHLPHNEAAAPKLLPFALLLEVELRRQCAPLSVAPGAYVAASRQLRGSAVACARARKRRVGTAPQQLRRKYV
eukprot:5817858-Pleurochrysis_carterae.AAC.2